MEVKIKAKTLLGRKERRCSQSLSFRVLQAGVTQAVRSRWSHRQCPPCEMSVVLGPVTRAREGIPNREERREDVYELPTAREGPTH